MKNFLLLALVLVLAVPGAPAATSTPSPEGGAEVKALADGYAQAFQRLYQARMITLAFERNGRSYTLKDVRKVEACEGVLVVTVGSGSDKYVLNPREVLFLTDAARMPAPDS